MQAKEYKIMVLGPRCGKTTFIKSLLNVSTSSTFPTTIGAQVTPYDMGTFNNEKYRLNLWEVGSKIQGLGKDYCVGVDVAIIFTDGSNEKYEEWVPGVPKIYVSDGYKVEDILQKLWTIVTKNKYIISKL